MKKGEKFDVIIIGAGISGLSAALELKKHRKKICLLEARDRVGGRIFSAKTPSGKVVEFGAQWVGAKQYRFHKLLSEHSIPTFKDEIKGARIISTKNHVKHYSSKIPPLPWLTLLDLFINLYRLERDTLRVPIESAYSAEYAEHWDGITVEAWANTHIHTQDVRDILNLFVESVYAVSSRDMSFLFFLYSLHNSLGPEYNLMDACEMRVAGGLSRLCEAMAKKLEGNIFLDSHVQTIEQLESQLIVSTKQKSYSANKVIVALPPVMASQISFTPTLPPMRDKLLQRMPMGSVIKCYALYKKPFWRENGLSGTVSCDTGLVRLIYDSSPMDDSYGALLVFLLGNTAVHIEQTSHIWIADTVINSLVKFFGEAAKEPEEFVFYNWNEDPWSRGGYSGYMPPGVLTSVGMTLLEPTGNIYWAGSEMSHEFNGYIEGAIESGQRVAKQIVDSL